MRRVDIGANALHSQTDRQADPPNLVLQTLCVGYAEPTVPAVSRFSRASARGFGVEQPKLTRLVIR